MDRDTRSLVLELEKRLANAERRFACKNQLAKRNNAKNTSLRRAGRRKKPSARLM